VQRCQQQASEQERAHGAQPGFRSYIPLPGMVAPWEKILDIKSRQRFYFNFPPPRNRRVYYSQRELTSGRRIQSRFFSEIGAFIIHSEN
jgi:hypothetical protein